MCPSIDPLMHGLWAPYLKKGVFRSLGGISEKRLAEDSAAEAEAVVPSTSSQPCLRV